MKISIVTLLFCFFIAESSFANGFKTGVYGSNNGDVHLITSRSGGKALGLYNTRGHVLLSGLSISGRATLFTGSFANGKTKGMVAFKKVNDKKWDGDWKYNRSNLPPRKWNGSWDGWYKNNNKLGGLYLWNTFKTDLGTMELIHNASGKVGGFLYANGKEYFVYGQLQGSNLKTFKGYISSDSEAIDVSPNYTLTFTWNNGMYGTATIPGKSRRTFRGATKQKRLKITLINIKNYENTGITHGSEWGKAKLNLEGVDEKGRLFKKDLYEDTKNIKWEENKTKLINKVFEHNLIYSSTNSGIITTLNSTSILTTRKCDQYQTVMIHLPI